MADIDRRRDAYKAKSGLCAKGAAASRAQLTDLIRKKNKAALTTQKRCKGPGPPCALEPIIRHIPLDLPGIGLQDLSAAAALEELKGLVGAWATSESGSGSGSTPGSIPAAHVESVKALLRHVVHLTNAKEGEADGDADGAGAGVGGPTPDLSAALVKLDVLGVVGACLGCPDTQVVFQALWVLTNVCAAPDAAVTCAAQFLLPAVIAHVSCTEYQVREQAVWCLANFAVDSDDFAEYVASQTTVLEVLLGDLRTASGRLNTNCLWALRTLLHSNRARAAFAMAPPRVGCVATAMCMAVEWQLASGKLAGFDDAINVLHSLLCTGSGPPGGPSANDLTAKALVDTHLVVRLLQAIAPETPRDMLTIILDTLGCLVALPDPSFTQVVVESGLRPRVAALLAMPRTRAMTKAAFFLVNNVINGTLWQCEALVADNQDLMAALVAAMDVEELALACVTDLLCRSAELAPGICRPAIRRFALIPRLVAKLGAPGASNLTLRYCLTALVYVIVRTPDEAAAMEYIGEAAACGITKKLRHLIHRDCRGAPSEDAASVVSSAETLLQVFDADDLDEDSVVDASESDASELDGDESGSDPDSDMEA